MRSSSWSIGSDTQSPSGVERLGCQRMRCEPSASEIDRPSRADLALLWPSYMSLHAHLARQFYWRNQKGYGQHYVKDEELDYPKEF